MELFDFEKPIEELEAQLSKAKEIKAAGSVDIDSAIEELEGKISGKECRYHAIQCVHTHSNIWKQYLKIL